MDWQFSQPTTQPSSQLLYKSFAQAWMIILMELSIIFFLTSIWVLRTPNAGQNMLFKSFLCKKVKKEEKAWKLMQNLEKQYFVWTRSLVEGFTKEHLNTKSKLWTVGLNWDLIILCVLVKPYWLLYKSCLFNKWLSID